MRALIAGGDRVGAIRVFQATADALAELGIEPGPVLRNLAARAERGEPASSLPSRSQRVHRPRRRSSATIESGGGSR